jgi:hypothetical protein
MEFTDLNNKVSSLSKNINILEGRQIQLEDRNKILIQETKDSVWFLDNKANIEEFLNELQKDVHQRTVGSYSKLLTALVQDVLPHNPVKIGMNIYTERGLPALDIFVDSSGKEISIMNGCGGSLNNVVSTGLRIIATAKSKMRRFVFLDEPDCWIKPDRVTGYFKILKELCVRMNFQAIVISHNNINNFIGSVDNIINLTGTPDVGLSVECDLEKINWNEDQEGIRSIRLKNFASFKDGILHFSPGINIITGDNNIGKSRVTQAFRALFYGDTDDGDIRLNEKRADLELTFDNDKVLYWSRGIKRNPINLWKLTDKNGNTLQSPSGEDYETGGRSVPDWVKDETKIARMEGLDYQISNQLTPVFLLNENPPKRAVVLSMGNESGFLDKIIGGFKVKCNQKQVILRNNEKELSNNLRLLKKIEDLPSLSRQIGFILTKQKEIEINNLYLNSLTDYGSKISIYTKKTSLNGKYIEILNNVIPDEFLDNLIKNLNSSLKISNYLDKLKRNINRLNILSKEIIILNNLTN